MNRNTIRQGDVLLIPCDFPEILRGRQPIPTKNNRVVLALGEVTGHAHAIYDVIDREVEPKVRLWDTGVERFLQVIQRCELCHEEHTAQELIPGWYRLPTQVEYTPAELRRVAD